MRARSRESDGTERKPAAADGAGSGGPSSRNSNKLWLRKRSNSAGLSRGETCVIDVETLAELSRTQGALKESEQ